MSFQNELLTYISDSSVSDILNKAIEKIISEVNNYDKVYELFLRQNEKGIKIFLSIKEKIHLDDHFITNLYSLIAATESNCIIKGINVDIAFLDVENISYKALKDDMFGFWYDICANKRINIFDKV